MTTSPTSIWLSRPEEHERTSRRAEAFIEARNRGQLHQMLLAAFIASGMTQSQLARRTGKPRETISRILAHPNNMEIDTASKMMFAMNGKAISFVAYDPLAPANPASNRGHRPDWAAPPLERRARGIVLLSSPNPASPTGNAAGASVSAKALVPAGP